MPIFYVIVGVVVLLVIWAIVSATQNKRQVQIDPTAPPPLPLFEPPEQELPKAHHWQEARTASVSKNFGRGGAPTGISTDIGTHASSNVDQDLERLKTAKPFEPRLTARGDMNLGDT